MENPEIFWNTIRRYTSEAWLHMQYRSHGEWLCDSEVPHASEIEDSYVNKVLTEMDSPFDALILATGDDNSHEHMIAIQGWLSDVMEYGRLVVTAMEHCKHRFGPLHVQYLRTLELDNLSHSSRYLALVYVAEHPSCR